MKEYLLKTVKSGGFIAFSIGFFLYIAINLPILINDKGILTFGADFYSQTIPFSYHIRDCLLSGEVCWDWSAGLGEQFLGSYAYYNLFSPFSIFYLIVPRNSIIYVLPYVTAIKYGVGSMTAYFYAERFLKNKHFAVIAGVIYMFSSFSAYNVIFHFVDIIALFPLLLIALEELCVNKRRCIFAITVAFMALLNYYFFFGQAVFCVIYYFVRLIDKDFKGNIKQFLSVAIEAVIGFMMTAVFMLPVIFQLADSSKATTMISLSDSLWFKSIFNYLKIIQSAFMIPDGIHFISLFPDSDTMYPYGNLGASLAAYIPLFSAAGVISYIVSKKKSWKSLLILICTVIAFVPVLNQAFSAFNAGYYARWFYMPMLIAVIMSAKALEEQISFKPGIITCGVVLGGMIIYQLLVDTSEMIPRVTPKGSVSLYQNILHFGVTALLLVVLIIVVRSKRDKEFIPKLYIFSIISCYITFGVMIHYVYSSPPGAEIIIDYIAADESFSDTYKNGDRISAGIENTNQMWEIDSVRHFNSLHDKGFKQFLTDSGLGYVSGVFDDITFHTPALADLTSVKYYFIFEGTDKLRDEDIVDYIGRYYVYENPNYIPMGFTYDSTISREEFLKIEDTKLRQKTYLKALIVEDVTVFSDILPNIDDKAGEVITDSEYEQLIADRREGSAYFCEKTSTGLTAKIRLEKENIVFFSTSYNENWTAYVDGSESKVYNVNNGLVGVRVPEGDHEITLTYKIRGIDIGMIITLCAASSLIIYAIFTHKKGKKNNVC